MNNVNKNESVPSGAHFIAVCGVRAARAPAPMGPALAFRLVIQIFRRNCLIASSSAWQTGALFCFRSLFLVLFFPELQPYMVGEPELLLYVRTQAPLP